MAELYQRLAKDNSILILANAAGATPRGTEPDAMLRRFIGELADALGIDDPLPESAGPDDVDTTFASLLCPPSPPFPDNKWRTSPTASTSISTTLSPPSASLSTLLAIIDSARQALSRIAASDPANAAWRRDLSVSHFATLGSMTEDRWSSTSVSVFRSNSQAQENAADACGAGGGRAFSLTMARGFQPRTD